MIKKKGAEGMQRSSSHNPNAQLGSLMKLQGKQMSAAPTFGKTLRLDKVVGDSLAESVGLWNSMFMNL